jgi:O-methyltransferase
VGRPVVLDAQLYAYVLASQPREHEELQKLRAFTATMPAARLQIAPEQGHLLTFLLRLVGAREVLELGTFTGYSALSMALALPAAGRVITCDNNAEWAEVGRCYWQRAGVADKINVRIGPALETLRALACTGLGRFDFIFIDANKDQYDDYYEASLKLVRPGGLIVLDNMLLRGLVVTEDRQPFAIAICRLNEKIAADPRVDHVLLPVGDGMTLVRRRPGRE